jgi:CheY-like chemotaxis protein
MAKKILLADDSITIQKVIELTFSDEDFDVITVGNGRLALERLPEVRPDIVLCDIIMPEKDGYEVCEHIKSNPSWSHLPVLLLTGAFEPFDQERAARAGYDGSLAKPFEPETLIAKVKDLLARAPSRPAPPPPAAAPVQAPTVVPFARPAALVPPPMEAAAPAAPAPSLGDGFITDEPFPDLGEPEPAAPPRAASVPTPPSPPLAALSEEESEMLSAPPPAEHRSAEDSASTVMFRPTELPWSEPAPAAPAPPPAPVAPPVARVVLPEPSGEPEPVLVPETPVAFAGAGVEEPPVFEAVLDEDLDFGPAGFEPEPAPEQAGGETLFSPEPLPESESLPEPEPVVQRPPAPERGREAEPAAAAVPVSSIDDLVSAAPPASVETGEPSFVEESLLEPEPETGPAATARFSEPSPYASLEPPFPTPEAAPPPPEPVPLPTPLPTPVPTPQPVPEAFPEAAPVPEPTAELAPEPPSPPAREPEPAPEPPPVPAPIPAIATPAEPPPAPWSPAPAVAAAAAGPLADLALPAEEPPAPPPSETAAFAVPVDMVEKIAQRVVAQVSEKVVREIAWEVIPDLAEALIKHEIERLKAELQKT